MRRWHHKQTTASSGNRVEAEVRDGDGPALILIPGTWGNAHIRERLIECLNPDLRLICIALAGQDQNWPPPEEPSIPRFSNDVLDLADALGLDRFFVGGHSLGGMIAIDLLRLAPGRIPGSIPIEGWTHWTVSKDAFDRDTSSTLDDEQRALIQRAYHELLDRWEPKLRDEFGTMWQRWDGWETLAATDVPVLEIWGDRGRARPPRKVMRIPDRDTIRIEWVPNASHALLVEAPERVAELVNSFITDLEP
jgi:pimeloyl-ACP methyl ester carboxylesterase